MKFPSAFLGAALVAAAPVQAQNLNCYGNYCSGTTRGGEPVQLNTYGSHTSGSIGGQPVQLNTYGNHTSGSIGGQSFSCYSYGRYTNCQ